MDTTPPYLKTIRYTKREWEDDLDIPETQYCEKVEVWWDKLTLEWVFECLINTQTEG